MTPTGAVLLRVLSAGASAGAVAAMRGRGAWGAGGRDPGRLSQRAPADPGASRLAEAGDVVVLSTDLDDLSPEYLEPLREALVAAGALDVQVWATQMKKGRTGFRVEAVVRPGEADRVCRRSSGTARPPAFGARRRSAYTLARRELQVDAGDGSACA